MIKSFIASEFRQNVAKILSANVVAQTVALLVYPFITRAYSPEEFGVFNVFMSICSVIFVLSTGRYESAIVQPKSSRDAAALFQVCLLITAVVSLISGVVVLLFEDTILNYFSLTSIGNGLYLLPFLVLFYGLGTACVRWHNRFKQYGYIGRYTLVQSIVGNGMKVLFGWSGYTRLGLLFATSMGYLLSLLSVVLVKGKRRIGCFLFFFDKSRMKSVAGQYSEYPKYSLPHSFINMLSGNLPLLMLAPYFNEKLIGFYALSMAVGFRPVNLVSTSFNQVFFQRVVELYNSKKSIKPVFTGFLRKGLAVFLPVFLLLYFTLPPIVSWLFGSDWSETATLLQIQLPWFCACMFTATMVFIPVIFFKQKTALVIEIIYACCRCIALLSGIFLHDFMLSVIAFSCVSTLFALVQLVWFYLLILRYERTIRE